MALSDLAIVRRSLLTRLFSTVTTVLTVATAVALMLTLLSLRQAGRDSFTRGTGNMHLLVSGDASPLVSVLNAVFYAAAPARALPMARAEALAADPRLEWALPVQQGDSHGGYGAVAVMPDFFARFEPVRGVPFALAQGRFLTADFEVVLGSEVAARTGKKVGDTIAITHGLARRVGSAGPAADVHDEWPLTVVGVLRPTGSAHDRATFYHLHATWLMHAWDFRLLKDPQSPRPAVADLKPAERLITGVFLRVRGRPGSELPANLPVIASELRRDPSITVAQPDGEIRTLLTIVGNIDRIIVAIAAVVLVSSGISIMLALYNSMEQRRRQIAVLRVLGASRGRIFGLIVTESALLGLLGAAAGALACVGGMRLVAAAVEARLGLVIRPVLDPESAVLTASATIVLASIAGIVPAVMAYRTSVVRGLRPLG